MAQRTFDVAPVALVIRDPIGYMNDLYRSAVFLRRSGRMVMKLGCENHLFDSRAGSVLAGSLDL